MIRASDNRALLDEILARYGLSPSCLNIVSDLKVWCQSNGINESGSSRAAKCFNTPEGCCIVMQDEQTDSMIASAKGAMNVRRGFDAMVATLDSDRKYLIHLMLHEIAFFILQTAEQEPRDDWAFHEMAAHAV